MKTFDELTAQEQKNAINRCIEHFLHGLIEGAIVFNDELNNNDFQERVDRAIKKANDMQTPWFAGEYVMDDCREEIEGFARTRAEDALYSEPNENVICGIIDA